MVSTDEAPQSTYRSYRFTAEDLEHMVDAGILPERAGIELIDGELLILNPQGPLHANKTLRLRKALERLYGEDRFHIREHSPVVGTTVSVPEPDVAIVRGDADDRFDTRHPGPSDIVLVVEISSESRRTDRRKAEIYAQVGYGAYWIIDLEKRSVTVHVAPKNGIYTKAEVIAFDDALALPELDVTTKLTDLVG